MATKCVVNKSTMTDIANAIRVKSGTSDTLLPSEMPAAIQAIPSGAPNQGGTPDDGWKNDGASHFWNYGDEDGWTFQICIGKVVGAAVVIAWGDGQSETLTVSNSRRIIQHVYAQSGAYRVDMTSGEGGTVVFGGGSVYNIAGVNRDTGRVEYIDKFTHVELGQNADQSDGYGECAGFLNLRGFRSRCIGKDLNVMFKQCQSLAHCDIGEGYTELRFSFQGAFVRLNSFLIPASVTNVTGSFNMTRGIKSISFAEGSTVTTLDQTFRSEADVENIEIPASVTTISNYAINIPNAEDVEIHFRGTTPPTFTSSNAINVHATAKFYVPYSADHSVLAAYKVTPNLSVYASQIYEEEES